MTSTPLENAWLAGQLSQLVGCVCVGWGASEEGEPDDLWPVLTFMRPDGSMFEVVVSKDFEGNGPGALLGLALPDGDLNVFAGYQIAEARKRKAEILAAAIGMKKPAKKVKK